MNVARGRLNQIRLDVLGEAEALIECPSRLIPKAGQYLMARSIEDQLAPLSTPLFPTELTDTGFWAAAPLPASWLPGTKLELRGVLGNGFSGYSSARRISVVNICKNPARLLPLILQANQNGAAITLFAEPPLPSLPAWLEINHLSALPELIHWSDFLALDLRLEDLPTLRGRLGLNAAQPLPCQGQALLYTPMPCAGLAECGVCAVPMRRGWKLACSDGPVFNLHSLEW